MSQLILDKLQHKFAHAIISTESRFGNETAVVQKDDLVALCTFLRDDPALKLNMPIDVTCVDWLEREPRFDVVYHFYSTEKKHRLRLKVPVDGEPPTVPSVISVWRGVDWFEREAYDMYGIIFAGHPNLKRILLYPEFIGYPLRKDYPIDKRQSLMDTRLRSVDYGTTGVSGDPTVTYSGANRPPTYDPTLVTKIGTVKVHNNG